MIDLSVIDILIISFYLFGCVVAGLVVRRFVGKVDDFLLAWVNLAMVKILSVVFPAVNQSNAQLIPKSNDMLSKVIL